MDRILLARKKNLQKFMSEIVRYGPRELWVVEESPWALPIHCDPHTSDGATQTHWVVRPALPLLAEPFARLTRLFGPNNMGRATTFWVVTGTVLERFAHRVKGCVPGDYLKWESSDPGKETFGKEILSEEDRENEFLNFCCDRASIDRPLGRFVWRAIRDGMMEWFINSQRPIGFELFTIHPVPFRANWKEILLAKQARCWKLFRGNRKLWKARAVASGFMEELGSTDLMAVRRDKTFSWTLEIQPHKLLLDEWARAEAVSMATKRPVRYARYYESCIRRRLNDIFDVFAAWIQQIQLSVGTIRESGVSCSPTIVPTSKRDKVLPSWHKSGQVTFQPPLDRPLLKQGQRARRRVEKKTQELLQVPGFQQGIADVRGLQNQSEMDRPGNGAVGADRVWLLPTGQGQAKEVTVLAVGEEPKP